MKYTVILITFFLCQISNLIWHFTTRTFLNLCVQAEDKEFKNINWKRKKFYKTHNRLWTIKLSLSLCVIYFDVSIVVLSSSGVSRSLHSRRWTHWSVLSHHGSRCRSSDVRRPDLQPRPCDRSRPHTRWQMGCPDASWHHPCQTNRQCHRLVLQPTLKTG